MPRSSLSRQRPAGTAADARETSVALACEQPLAAFDTVRGTTERLCESLEIEDYGLQSMEGASPAKWHLAHTTWFFETFVLGPAMPDYRVFHERFGFLFNSYYESVGSMHPRPKRGLLSRPTVREVYAYREHVDQAMHRLIETGGLEGEALRVFELGLHHEQQHQELLVVDLKHAFYQNSLRPSLSGLPPSGVAVEQQGRPATTWIDHPGGISRVGHDMQAGQAHGFAFDSEGPAHRVFHEPFGLQSRLVTCGEYLEFIADGGYERVDLWLSNGWQRVQSEGWRAPLYWEHEGGRWRVFTTHGMLDVNPHEPVCHVSLYEADAYARWTGYRLPSEFEWETSFRNVPVRGNLLESGRLHPAAARDDGRSLQQGFGDVWEWTGSAYAPYPAYRAPKGALGEYNGKFMCSQHVLRGGSCVTPAGHMRASYRNFFYPEDRWQFSGIRLARDL